MRLKGFVMQVVQGQLQQVIVPHVGVIDGIEVYAEPVRQFREFLKVSRMEPGIRVPRVIREGIGKVLIQITPLHDAVCLFQFVIRERDYDFFMVCVSFNLKFFHFGLLFLYCSVGGHALFSCGSVSLGL